jgi:tRNA A-37 threonylcarbamoyl transferase component Bud32
MLDANRTADSLLTLETARAIDAVSDRFEAAWRRGDRPRAEDYLADLPAHTTAALLAELLELDLYYRRRCGEAPDEAEYRERFPAHADLVAFVFGRRPARHGGAPPELAGYEVLEVLGRGGMGIVYKARQKSLKRIVALKLLPPAARAEGEPAARFRVEAQATARLQHPNIVQVYEAGESGGVPFYAMEYVAGRTLAEALRDGPPPPRQAAEWLEQVARAVHYAHQQGVIHRDLKPANVLLLPDGPPKITDFGLAKPLGSASELTTTGQVLGTPSYMAPEQVRGTARVGPASDVYSLGAVLYAALTGQPPFRAETIYATLSQVAEAEPVAPRRLRPDIPRDLETICLKCLRKEPGQRYATAQEVADDLRRWLSGEPPRARRAGVVERVARRARRHPLVALLLVLWLVTLIALLLALALLWSGYGRSPPGDPSSAASTRRVSSIRPAVRWAYASSTASHSSRVNGTASAGPGTFGTSRRAMASHSSGIPAPVRAETWAAPAARLSSHAGGKSTLLTTRKTRSGVTSGQTGSALASRVHRHRSADDAAALARSIPCPSRVLAS